MSGVFKYHNIDDTKIMEPSQRLLLEDVKAYHRDLSCRNMLKSKRESEYIAIDWELTFLSSILREIRNMLKSHFIHNKDIGVCQDLIDFSLPGLIELTQREPKEIYHAFF